MIHSLLPGLGLLCTGCVLIILGILQKQVSESSTEPAEKVSRLDGYAWLSLISITLIWLAWYLWGNQSSEEHSGLFCQDAISRYGTHLTMLSGILFTLIMQGSTPRAFAAEFHGCFLLLLSGLVVVAAADDLTTLYLGLELVSIPTTVLLAISRKDSAGLEATLKYFSLSAFSSAIFLMGASYLFGIAGSTNIQHILEVVSQHASPMSKLAIAFLLAGLAFRITAVPFHYYAPDVFSGTSLPMVGLLSTIPKIAGFIGIVRLLGGDLLLTGLAESAMSTLLILAIATMTVGNLMALVQNDWRRLLAYSSVSHSGYLLVGVLASLKQGTPPDAVFLYLTVYIVMTSGMVAGLVSLSQSSSSKMGLDELKGLYYRQPWLAISLTITLLSMIGVPLTAGFWAKFQIFFSAAEANNYWINICAIIMAFHAALAAIYYLGAISKMYEFGETNPSTIPHLKPKLTTSGVTCLACSLVIVAWFFMPL